jgi:hypothetical protein
MHAPRVKISGSLPRVQVARTAQALEAATIAYYESLAPEEQREEARMATAFSAAARRRRVDDAAVGRSRRRRKR